MRILLSLGICILLTACVSAPQTRGLLARDAYELPLSSNISGTPFFPQTLYHCGPAALATVLSATDLPVTPDELVPLVYVPGRTGSFQTEVTATARSFGRLAYQLLPELEDLLTEIAAGNPVLVLQNLGLSRIPQWHFAVVKGYDLAARELRLNSGEIEDYRLDMAVFERTWARASHWALVITVPGTIPATAQEYAYLQALIDLQHSYAELPVIELGYRRGLAKWPDSRELRMGLGNILLDQEKLTAAIDVYTLVVSQYPEYGPARNNLAQALLEQGDLEQALLQVQQAIALHDDFQQTYQRTLAEIQRRQQSVQ